LPEAFARRGSDLRIVAEDHVARAAAAARPTYGGSRKQAVDVGSARIQQICPDDVRDRGGEVVVVRRSGFSSVDTCVVLRSRSAGRASSGSSLRSVCSAVEGMRSRSSEPDARFTRICATLDSRGRAERTLRIALHQLRSARPRAAACFLGNRAARCDQPRR
jgi:hypothetical protein